jgi:cobaltochelatase CobS
MSKIKCEICGAEVHAIQRHLETDHPDVSLDAYKTRFPAAPLLSELMKAKLAERKAQAATPTASTPAATPTVNLTATAEGATAPTDVLTKKPLHETFALGAVKAALSAKGGPIPITTFVNPSNPELVPKVSDGYVYDVDELKNVILALELNIPTYVWGHKGAGKTELFEQVCARTGRALWRNQHTVNTEESHIVGQWVVRAGETRFELGPLAMCMKHGWVYMADEYDFALPSVLAVYQAVLEGKPLVIKEADAENRIIRPHPNFRFVATGNTNGAGDETGLYQGTSIQNSANYDRFGMVIHKQYMAKAAESLILQNRVGLVKEDADKLVDFANKVREAYGASKISDTISPRTLIYAAQIGVKRGSFRQGLTLSFINKLSTVDREVVDGVASRVFG